MLLALTTSSQVCATHRRAGSSKRCVCARLTLAACHGNCDTRAGKLDLYTVCGGFNPNRTIPVIIDAGCGDADHNTAGIDIRGSDVYTGEKRDRVTMRSPVGTVVNSAYYGEGNMIEEFFEAATDLFGRNCVPAGP